MFLWLPLSPYQKVTYEAVREKPVDRWAGWMNNSGMNNMCFALRLVRMLSYAVPGQSASLG